MKLCGCFDGPVLGFAVTQSFWGYCGSRLDCRDFALCIMGSLNVCSGESSTLTLFLRVMDTFDDDDDDFNTSTLQHFNILKLHFHLTFNC